MKPSTLTPSGKPHNRGFLVKIDDGRRGRTYHHQTYINDKVAVYLEKSSGDYSDQETSIAREKIKVIGYID